MAPRRRQRYRPRRRRWPRRLFWVVIVVVPLVAAGVVLVASARDGSVRSGPPAQPAPSSVLPLLGTPGTASDRAALAVKIDDTERGRPPTGLLEADVVFEEVVEGGLTRLLAIYQSEDPGTVGPVRSARSTDLLILAELGRPLFAWSGANPTFQEAVEAADLVDVGFDAASDAYGRDSDRQAPYNLFVSPEGLREAGADADADASRTPPAPLFSYRAEGEPLAGPGVTVASTYSAGGSPAASVATAIAWDWDSASGAWVRTQDGTPHVDSDGTRVGVENVIIRATPYRDSGIRDSTGAVVPEAVMVGEGDAWLLIGGQMQQGRWQKASPEATTTYTALDGTPLLLAPGRTWVEVLPPDVAPL